ncbi:MAG: phage integrase family protein [Devosia sp.]|nr:phage integrase family protein [Devosia sp.]
MTFQIKDLLEEAEAYLAKPKVASTVNRYRRVYKTMNLSGLGAVGYVAHVAVVMPAQFVLTRSAIIYGLWTGISHKIREAVRKITQRLTVSATDDVNLAAAYRQMIEDLHKQNPPQDAFTRKGKSKRGCLRILPDNWRKRLADNTSAEALPAVLVSLLSGCRPEELSMGITVSVINDRYLCISINGAKVTEKNGQPWRKLTFDVGLSDLAAVLWRITSRKGGVLQVKREPRTLHKNMVSASAKAGLPSICAYIARHYLASQLKHAWCDDKKAIAMALGHASTATQKAYETRQQGRKGGLALVSVEAARQVRTPDRPHPGLAKEDFLPQEDEAVASPWNLEPSPYD